MHVCHVITRLIVGGAQENTVLTCEGLAQRGHRVTLISGPTRGPEGSLVPRVRGGAYTFIEVPQLVRRVSPRLDWAALRALKSLYHELRPDVIHTHSSKAGILGRFAAPRNGPAVVHTIHGMSFNRTQPWLVRRVYATLEKHAARRTHAIVTVADAMIEQSLAAGVCERSRMTTIHSGMETELFDASRYDRARLRRSWGVEPQHVVVVTVARMFRRKGYEQLLPALARAAAGDANLRFVWIGDGAQRAEYEAELTRLGLRQRTTLTGLVPPERIPELLSGCDLLAHASQWEGLPRVAVQALLCGLPVVAFDIDGTPEVVTNGRTGVCVPLGDEAGFAAGILRLAADPELRRSLAETGRTRCLHDFNWRRMVERLEELYARCLNR
jgi:glycosyltransferase involved in cell wall biosynthesis